MKAVPPRVVMPTWVRGYERTWLRGDVLAGITVTAYLIPQVMAYAEVAGQHVTAQPRPLVAADPRGHPHGLHGVRLEPVDGRRRAPANRFRVKA